MSEPINVVAEIRYFAGQNRNLGGSGVVAPPPVVFDEWADYVERLEAEKTVARELINDLATELSWLSTDSALSVWRRVKKFLNAQQGDTLQQGGRT